MRFLAFAAALGFTALAAPAAALAPTTCEHLPGQDVAMEGLRVSLDPGSGGCVGAQCLSVVVAGVRVSVPQVPNGGAEVEVLRIEVVSGCLP